MSQQALQHFLDVVARDHELQHELDLALDRLEGAAAAVAGLADRRGYHFTAEEFEVMVRTICRAEAGELSDDQLASLAAGTLPTDKSGLPKPLRQRLSELCELLKR